MAVVIFPHQAKNLYEEDCKLIKTSRGQEELVKFKQKFPDEKVYADYLGYTIKEPQQA